MKRYEINHYSTFGTLKASVVERFNRTLKELMRREFTFKGKYSWLQIYKELINNYNNRKHRTIKMKAIDVIAKNEKQILMRSYNHLKIFTNGDFKGADHVRISKYKNVFEKGYTQNWTTEIFRIRKMQNTSSFTYLL